MSNELDELTELLERLQNRSQPISSSMLYGLSDLAGERLDRFRAAWPTFSLIQRRRLLQALAELTELSFEVHFDPIFQHCLNDPDEEVRATAIHGLWECEDTQLIGPLLMMLRADPSAEVRAAAAGALGRYMLLGELEQLDARIQARILTELLTTFYLAEESVSVRRRAIESASYACTPEILDALELAYYDGKAPMRMSAVVGMGRSGDQRWKEIILDELGSESPAMRYEAAWASGEMSLRPAVPLLARLIDDPDPQVSFAAIWALGQIGGERAKQTLVAAYDVADDDTQAALDDALAELALLEGDLEFLLYELGADPDDEWLDDEYTALWTADDDTDQFDGDSRDLDDI